MSYSVDYELVNDLGLEVSRLDEELVRLFNDIIKIINDLDKGWAGNDCETFKSVSINYLKSLNNITDQIYYIASYMKKASSVYSGENQDWKSNVQKIGEEKDEEYNS